MDADQFRTFILDGRHSRTFSPTYCWGCPIVVIAGQDRVLIAHVAEVVGDDGTFDTHDNYNEHAVQPITNLINANLKSLGRNPAVMVFAKAASVRDAAHWLHRGRLDNLINAIAVRLDISVNYITQDAYITQGAWNEERDTITGKVTVVWTVPGRRSSDRRGELQTYAEDRRIIRTSYLCNDSRTRCTIS